VRTDRAGPGSAPDAPAVGRAGRLLSVRRLAGVLVGAAAGWVLAGRVGAGLHAVGQLDRTSPAAVGPAWALVVGMLVLTATGALPAWQLVGRRLLAVCLAPCIGALVASVSAMVAVAVASEPLRWFVAFAAAVDAAALASVAARRGPRQAPTLAWHQRLPRVLPPTLVVVAVGYVATTAGRGGAGRSAAAGWLALASALVRGHRAVRPLLSTPLAAAHLLGAPLGSGCAAVGWLVTGQRSTTLAAGLVALVAAAAVAAGACALGEVGGVLARRVGAGGGVLRTLGWVVGAAWAVAVCATAGGLSPGASLTTLWVAALVGAGLLTLVLPPAGWSLRSGVILLFVAAWASPMGTVTAAMLTVAVWVRRAVWAGGPVEPGGPGAGGRPVEPGGPGPTGAGTLPGGRLLVARAVDGLSALVVLGALAAWPVVSAVVSAAPPAVGLPPRGLAQRLQATWQAVGGRLGPAALALAVAAAGAVALTGCRRRFGLGSDAGLVFVGGGSLLVTLAARGWDVRTVAPLLQAPPTDGAALPLLLGTAVVAVWVVAAVGAIVVPAQATAVVGSPAGPGAGGAHPPDLVGAVGPGAMPGVGEVDGVDEVEDPGKIADAGEVDGSEALRRHFSP